MIEEEGGETRRRNPLLWPVRSLLHLIIKTIVVLFVGIRVILTPKPIRYGLLLLLVTGVVGWNILNASLQQPAVAAVPTSGNVSVAATSQLPQNQVVERYLRAQADFNAQAMWATLSDDLKEQMGATDAMIPQLQAELDAARQQGRRYSRVTYAGGVPMSSGKSVYFYVVTVETPEGKAEVPYIYVVGPDGKIASIQ